MIEEVRKLKKRDWAKGIKVQCAQQRGKIRKLANENGYLCYDTEEFEKYHNKARVGRPIKF